MYEYKCSNETCSHAWTIKEGDINSMYLTCPVCKKGRGQFVRQIKGDEIHEDIQRIPIRKTNDDYLESIYEVTENKKAEQDLSRDEEQEEKKTRGRKKKVQEPEIKNEEIKEEKKTKKKSENKEVQQVENNDKEPEEEDIFTRIRKKRQMEEELRNGFEDEDIDILEVSGGSLEEIENRIKEFEEYYYIKVLDKNIQQQGKRYNCIIKYCRK